VGEIAIPSLSSQPWKKKAGGAFPLHYVGQITKFNYKNDDVGRFEVHFLRRSSKMGNTFVDTLSESQAVDDINEQDVVCLLPDPVVRRGLHTFPFSFADYSVE
jgi:hypothetical protein